MQDWKERLKDEKSDLFNKIIKLERFINESPNAKQIQPYQLELMVTQLETMKLYQELLMERIKADDLTKELSLYYIKELSLMLGYYKSIKGIENTINEDDFGIADKLWVNFLCLKRPMDIKDMDEVYPVMLDCFNKKSIEIFNGVKNNNEIL